jgi:ribosomal protein L11 methyltransferase
LTWIQLRLDTRPEDVEALETLMLAAGAVAVTLQDNADQPVLEPAVGETPLWHQVRMTGLYPADADMDAVLSTFPDDLQAGTGARVEILEDKDWEREWMQHYRPMKFGRRLWVCPSWLAPPEPDAINLLLDPGLAFGTGTHPTTALCLAALDGLDLDGKTLVDYGCGSGILAVAALKLGARRVLGVDNDPQALLASRDNAARNGLPPEALPVALPTDPEVDTWTGATDVVVANILAGPLIQLADRLVGLLRPGGNLLLSGLLESQAAEVRERYAPRVALEIRGCEEGWVCLGGTLT